MVPLQDLKGYISFRDEPGRFASFLGISKDEFQYEVKSIPNSRGYETEYTLVKIEEFVRLLETASPVCWKFSVAMRNEEDDSLSVTILNKNRYGSPFSYMFKSDLSLLEKCLGEDYYKIEHTYRENEYLSLVRKNEIKTVGNNLEDIFIDFKDYGRVTMASFRSTPDGIKIAEEFSKVIPAFEKLKKKMEADYRKLQSADVISVQFEQKARALALKGVILSNGTLLTSKKLSIEEMIGKVNSFISSEDAFQIAEGLFVSTKCFKDRFAIQHYNGYSRNNTEQYEIYGKNGVIGFREVVSKEKILEFLDIAIQKDKTYLQIKLALMVNTL